MLGPRLDWMISFIRESIPEASGAKTMTTNT